MGLFDKFRKKANIDEKALKAVGDELRELGNRRSRLSVGDLLRGTNIVYYSKPRAEYVTNAGPLDEDAIRRYFKGVCEAASGCLFEVAQREVGTIYGDFERGKRYVQLAKESIDKYWKP